MAKFFILPPREQLEHYFGQFVGNFLQDTVLPIGLFDRVFSELVEAQNLNGNTETFVFHREELLKEADQPLNDALIDCCGAEEGDEVCEIEWNRIQLPSQARHWHITVKQSQDRAV